MRYYLRTLEGVGPLGMTAIDFRNRIGYRREEFKQDLETAVYYQLWEIIETEGAENYELMRYFLRANYKNEPAVMRAIDRVENELEAEAQRAAIDAQRAEDERRKAEAEAEAQRAAIDAKRAEDERRKAEAEAEAQRAAIDAKRAAEAQQAAAIVEEAENVINEGTTMNENIEIGTQLITSGKEYTIIDETEKTISYVDENGELHVIEKTDDGWGWILAAAIGALFII